MLNKTPIDKINEMGQPEIKGYFSHKEAMFIMQHEVGYTKCDSDKYILGTYGASTCVIVAMYNFESKTSALAHIDASTDIYHSLYQMTSKISDKNRSIIEVHLRGGDSSSSDMVLKITDYLSGYLTDKYNIFIKSASLIHDYDYFETENNKLGKELAINSCNGEIYNDFSYQQLDHGADFWIKLESLAHRLVLAVGGQQKSFLSIGFDGTAPDSEL